MSGYYDAVLGLIPLSLAGLTALLLAAGMTLSVSIPLASLVTVGLMGHALFVNAPTDTAGGGGSGDSAPSGNGLGTE